MGTVVTLDCDTLGTAVTLDYDKSDVNDQVPC